MFPTDCEYFCQEDGWMDGWMDEGAILEWVEQILKLCIATDPENVVPLLMLNSFLCHKMVWLFV